MTKKGEKLTLKQETFVSEYLKTGNATEAARRAGYQCKSDHAFEVQGNRLLRNAEVLRAIDAKNKKRNDRLELEEDFELKKAIEIMQMCMEPKHVYGFDGKPIKNSDGNYVMQFDSKGANTALQTIAKIRGKFVQKVQVGFADSLAEQLEGVSE